MRGVGVRFSSAFSSGFLHAELQWSFFSKANVLLIHIEISSIVSSIKQVTYATLETLLVFKKRSEAHGILEKRLSMKMK